MSTLILEMIQRKKQSLDVIFDFLIKKTNNIKYPNQIYQITENALKHFAIADYILEKSGNVNISLRRRSAFRIAYYLLMYKDLTLNEIKFISGGLLPTRFLKLLTKDNIERIKDEIQDKNIIERYALLYSIPSWIIKIFYKNFGEQKTRKLLTKNEERIYWIRINTLLTSINNIKKKLKRHEIEYTVDDEIPFLLKIQRFRSYIDFHKFYIKNLGYIILQDKGSIIVVKSLNPQKKDKILDLAAAPGLKTSLIQQLNNNDTYIVAVDISYKRTIEGIKLLSSLGVKNISFIVGDGSRITLRKKFDKILLDAPCSNSGAIRNNPAFRLILWSKPKLDIFYRVQKKLLSNAINLLTEDGVLVYSTCSFSPVEGEKHIDEIIEKEKNLKISPNIEGVYGYKGYKCRKYIRRLFPFPNDTIGFFISRIIK